ncbi:MAG: hypothetical protein ACXVAX_10275 [Pseudobdellovibrio sp.]
MIIIRLLVTALLVAVILQGCSKAQSDAADTSATASSMPSNISTDAQ